MLLHFTSSKNGWYYRLMGRFQGISRPPQWMCSQIRGWQNLSGLWGIRCFDKVSQKLIEDFDDNNANLNNARNNVRR